MLMYRTILSFSIIISFYLYYYLNKYIIQTSLSFTITTIIKEKAPFPIISDRIAKLRTQIAIHIPFIRPVDPCN